MDEQKRPNFPSGNVAFQERYIAAFKGLTELITAPATAWKLPPEDAEQAYAQWLSMFNALAGVEENEDATETG